MEPQILSLGYLLGARRSVGSAMTSAVVMSLGQSHEITYNGNSEFYPTMNRSVSQTARTLGVDVPQVKKWAWLFKEHLSEKANPTQGQPRTFTDSDLLTLIHVALRWEEGPDIEEVRSDLEQGDFDVAEYRKLLYRHTPILQEPPDELDETWTHGMLLNGGSVDAYLELARNYRRSAEKLLGLALESREILDWGHPVLFLYRHSLELYLKVIGEIQESTHSLRECVDLVEKRLRKKMGSPMREWILQFDGIDPKGTAFRYADDEAKTLRYSEFWVDFLQLKFAMGLTFDRLDHGVLWTGANGRAPAKTSAGKTAA